MRISLHIGLNNVDPRHYGGWDGQLVGCEPDANDMRKLATDQGFQPNILLTKAATRDSVMRSIRDCSTRMNSGDCFFLTYSGHGGQVPDMNGDESDKMDETWVLYDGEMLDDEIFGLLAEFKEGVKVLVLSDSCHSGTVVRTGPTRVEEVIGKRKPKYMPTAVARKTYEINKDFYDNICRGVKEFKQIKCSVILISGCQDNQLSYDGQNNGLFTEKLLAAWNFGRFSGSYYKFHKNIVRRMPPEQTPNMMLMGGDATRFAREPVLKK